MAQQSPTPRQRKAALMTSENLRSKKPQSIGKVLIKAGYSQSVAESPSIVTESRGFQQLMKEILPEELVTTRHQELLNAGSINHYEFYGKTEYRDVDQKDEDDEFLKEAKAIYTENDGEVTTSLLQRKLRIGYARAARLKDLLEGDGAADDEAEVDGDIQPKKKSETITVIATDEEIKNIIESVAGCKLIYIKQFGTGTKVAYFSQPDNRSRKDAIDMAYKLRGSYVKEDAPPVNPLAAMIGDAVLGKLADQLNEQYRKNNAATIDNASSDKRSDGAEADPVGDQIQAQD